VEPMVTSKPIVTKAPVKEQPQQERLRGVWGKKKALSQRLIALTMISSDVVLALMFWEIAALVQGIWGRGELSLVQVVTIAPDIAVWIGLRALLGLYPGYGLDAPEELRRQTYAVFATSAVTAIFAVALHLENQLSRMLLALVLLSLLLLAPLARQSVKQGMKKIGLWGKPVVILGSGATGEQMVRLLKDEWELGFNPVAVFDNRLVPAGGALEGVPYGGTLADGMQLAKESGIDTAIFAMPHIRRQHLARFVNWASLAFRHVVVIPNLGGVTNSAVTARNLGGVFGIEIKYNLLSPWALRFKRIMDITATLIGGAFVLPLILVLSLLVWLESRGSIFYKDKRMCKDGSLFSCIKFQTMVPDAETILQKILNEDVEARKEYLRYHKLRNDPRVTRVGRFLRKTSLDELPQIWNVLRGEMSLVGPRPYLPRESEDIGVTQSEILRVPPGITGPWQVSGRNNTTFDDRVEMDARYVQDWSVWLDIVLLARTFTSVLRKGEAY
jgi:Undecaprenyl-phosphate galactose phosphotransferase WbaP